MQPKFQRKKDSSEVVFCQIKRETPLPPEWLPSFFTFPLSRGYAFPPFRRPAAAGEIGCRWAGWALPPSGGGGAGVHRRGTPCPRRGAKGGKGTVWFPCPLLTPPNPPSSRSAKHSRLNGGYEGSVPCVVSLMGRCKALNLLCVIRRA